MEHLCPKSQTPGKQVKTVTVESLARENVRSVVSGRDWTLCPTPECDVVYFASDGETLLKGDLTVRVGFKEREAPHPVCYCFGHSVESIGEEVKQTGGSTVVDSITAKVKAGECSCEVMNPKGDCCLGDVRRVVKEAIGLPSGDAQGVAEECCTVSSSPEEVATAEHPCCLGSDDEEKVS